MRAKEQAGNHFPIRADEKRRGTRSGASLQRGEPRRTSTPARSVLPNFLNVRYSVSVTGRRSG